MEKKEHQEYFKKYEYAFQGLADRVIAIQKETNANVIWIDLYDGTYRLNDSEEDIALSPVDIKLASKLTWIGIDRITYHEEESGTIVFGVDGNHYGFVYAYENKSIRTIRKYNPAYDNEVCYSLGSGWYVFADSWIFVNRFWREP